MKEGFNLKNLFSSYDKKDNGKYLVRYSSIGDDIIFSIFTIFICVFGLVGNVIIIWLLGFRMKRKTFATYILNLAVADFGSLLCLLPLNIFFNPPCLDANFDLPNIVVVVLMILFFLMYSSCQLHLTAISIDQCVSVLFPNWYQHHHSPALSTSVCALIWALSFVLGGMPFMVFITGFPPYYGIIMIVVYLGSSSICLSLVALSTLTLFIKLCCKSQPCQCGNLLKVILLMLLSFFLFSILTCASVLMDSQGAYTVFLASLKSSINPPIYVLVGRQNNGKFQEKMKLVLQRVFKEERHQNGTATPYPNTAVISL